MSNWFWTWRGVSFGYRKEDQLFTYRGVQAGRFYDDDVYGADGRYLGEIKSGNRLITDRSKKNRRKGAFGRVHGGSYARYANYVGYAMYADTKSFPTPTASSKREKCL
jgi:hypothetical protein